MKLENERYEVTFVDKEEKFTALRINKLACSICGKVIMITGEANILHCFQLSETHIQRIIRLMGRRMQ